MIRKKLETLIVGDDDLECKCKKENLSLDDLNLTHVGFLVQDLEKFDLIVYKGQRGQKVLKIKNLG